MDNVAVSTSGGPVAETWGGPQLLAALRAAARWLEQHVDMVNALNVFPVPDGDTGTNMSLTLSGALDGVQPEPSCAAVADRVRYWATMRGRGNSGIILSQVLRGFALGLAGHERMGAPELAAALTQASGTAYQAVMKPVEGTLLTVIRESSEAASVAAAAGLSLVETLAAAAQGAQDSVARTPTLLKTLRDAGVVDAGGQGLALVFDGLLRYARGESVELAPADQAAPLPSFQDIHGPDDFGYCTNFVLQGQDMPFAEIRTTLAAMGQSVAVAGDAEMMKVHIHLLRPGDALNYAVGFGALSQIEITNMDLQRAALHQAEQAADTSTGDGAEPPLARIGVVAVSPGDGFAAIFRSLQVGAIVEGGQTMNPSTADLLAAIDQLPQQQVIILPNNGNIVMAARQAAQLSGKQVEVVPSKTVPQGLAAMLGFNFQADLGTVAQTMTAAMQGVSTGEITQAVRDATVDGIAVRAGQTIGLLDGDLVTAEDTPDTVVDQLLGRMELGTREIVALYYGQSASQQAADALAARILERFPNLGEVEVLAGGQALYEYIISAE